MLTAVTEVLPPLTLRSFARGMVGTCVAVGAASFFGDAISQRVSNDGDGWTWWDRQRSQRMALTGFAVGAPISYTWNQFLERQIPGRTNKAIFSKIMCNALFAPFQIAVTFTVITLLNGRGLKDAQAKITHDLPVTYAAGSLYWPFIGFIQFRFVPVNTRPVVGSLAGIVYQTFFASMANRPVPVAADVADVPVPEAQPQQGARP